MAATRVGLCVLRRLQMRNLSCSPAYYGTKPPEWMGDFTPFSHKMLKDQFTDEETLLSQQHLIVRQAGNKTLEEKLEEAKIHDEEVEKPVNIGLQKPAMMDSIKKTRQQMRKNRLNTQMEQAARHQKLKIPLDQVKSIWQQEYGPEHMKAVAEHYGIYDHLFNNAYFYPLKIVDVTYDYDDEYVSPVYMGNKLLPKETSTVPSVEFSGDEGKFYTLIMTNPDGHLVDNDKEYLHWMLGNIPGSDMSRGEVVCDYLQPFPPEGTGLHRHIFLLFQHDSPIDYSKHKRSPNCTSLKERTFKTYDFYKELQDSLIPVGLNFFQSEYDETLHDFYHNVLNMRVPLFAYRHEPFYHPPMKMYPRKQPFDRYYDRYRDRKDIAEEVLKMKMDMISPFSDYPKQFQYPNIHRPAGYRPSWLKRRDDVMNRRLEQFKDLPK